MSKPQGISTYEDEDEERLLRSREACDTRNDVRVGWGENRLHRRRVLERADKGVEQAGQWVILPGPMDKTPKMKADQGDPKMADLSAPKKAGQGDTECPVRAIL